MKYLRKEFQSPTYVYIHRDDSMKKMYILFFFKRIFLSTIRHKDRYRRFKVHSSKNKYVLIPIEYY